jgi:hypothetical protein
MESVDDELKESHRQGKHVSGGTEENHDHLGRQASGRRVEPDAPLASDVRRHSLLRRVSEAASQREDNFLFISLLQRTVAPEEARRHRPLVHGSGGAPCVGYGCYGCM